MLIFAMETNDKEIKILSFIREGVESQLLPPPLKAMEENRSVRKFLVKLWSQFELLCGMPANEKNKNPMDKLGR